MQCRKKPIGVNVRRVEQSEVVLTAHGRVRAEPGDYVLSDPRTGDTWPVKPDIFVDTYEVLPETLGGSAFCPDVDRFVNEGGASMPLEVD